MAPQSLLITYPLKEFQAWLECQDKSPNTCRAYLYSIRQFLSIYHEISHENLLYYKCYLIEHYKPQTVNLRISALNSYIEYLNLPFDKLMIVRIQQKSYLENVISQADYEYLKNCLLHDGHIKYYFAVHIMATTGLRISELVQLQCEDIRNGYKDICSKGNRIRRVFIPHVVQIPCLKWLHGCKRMSGSLFMNRFGAPISTTGLRNQLKHLAILYKLIPNVIYPHTFRHLFAKNFIERNDDIAMLADILGHRSIDTTRIYLRKNRTEQKQIFNQIVTW